MGSILVYKIAYVWLMGGKSKNMAFRFAQYEVKALLGKMAGCGGMYPTIYGLWVIIAFCLILTGWSGIGNNTVLGFAMTSTDYTLEVCVCTGLAMCVKIFYSIAVYRITLGHDYWRLNAILGSVFLGLFIWRLIRFVPMYGSTQTGAIIGPGLVLVIFMVETVCVCMNKKKCEADIARMAKIREYIGANKEFVWTEGADKPDGLELAAVV